MSETQQNYISDITDEELEVQQEGFKIDNDELADWTIEQMKGKKAEVERLEKIAKMRIETIKLDLERKLKPHKNSITFFESKLNEYINSLNLKPNKSGNIKHQLLAGDLKLTKQQPEFIRDNDKLVKYLENRNDEIGKMLIKTKKDADWAKVKEILTYTVVGETLVDSQGEIIGGVTVKAREPKFEVKI